MFNNSIQWHYFRKGPFNFHNKLYLILNFFYSNKVLLEFFFKIQIFFFFNFVLIKN
jgi:hypothetical protein